MKKISAIHLYCKMIEQNSSLGTNVLLPSFEMPVVFLSGSWAWFAKGAVQQIVYGSTDFLMY